MAKKSPLDADVSLLGSMKANVASLAKKSAPYCKKLIPSIPVFLLIFGLIFAVLGSIILAEEGLSLGEKALWTLARDFGVALVTGGVFAVLIETLQFLGVFRDAIAEIMAEDKFLERRNDLEKVWKKVTELICGNRFSNINNHLYADVLSKYLPSQQDFYYENYRRTCIVNWKKALILFSVSRKKYI